MVGSMTHARHLSGALGAGLAIISKWPIIATSMTPYSLTGEPTDVFGGDWFVGKGAGSVTIMHPVLGQVQLFVTHVSLPTHSMSRCIDRHASSVPRAERKVLSTTGHIAL